MSTEKDKWDKLDVSSRMIGAIVIPLTIAFSAYYLNSQAKQRETLNAQVQLAFEIIERPELESIHDDQIRRWAFETIANPKAVNEFPGYTEPYWAGLFRSRAEYEPSGTVICDYVRTPIYEMAEAGLKLELQEDVADDLNDFFHEAIDVARIVDAACEDYWEQEIE